LVLALTARTAIALRRALLIFSVFLRNHDLVTWM